jgi:hypothetical protein
MADYAAYASFATFALGVVAYAVRITWKLSESEKAIRVEMDAQIDNVQRDVVKLERAGIERSETVRNEFGETAAALRQKMHDMETWNRDTFVKNEKFDVAVGRIEKLLEKSVDRLEAKFDRAVERIQSHKD